MEIRPTHTCFDDALDFIEELLREDPRRADGPLFLCHAICTGPKTGEPFAHAWVEWEGEAYQDGFAEELGRVRYVMTLDELERELTPRQVTRYTVREAARENHRAGHYGPWRPEYRALCGKGDRRIV